MRNFPNFDHAEQIIVIRQFLVFDIINDFVSEISDRMEVGVLSEPRYKMFFFY